MGRIQGLSEKFLTGDELVKTGVGFVFSITIAWTGATAGQAVVLRDGTDGAGAPLVPFILNAATGTITREWSQGKKFENGLFYDVQGAGSIQAEMTYK